MKKIILTIFFISSVTFVYAAPIKWHNFNTGLELAQKQNKPIIVALSTEWCHWCKVMKKETFADQKVSKYINENFIAIYLDPEKEKSKIKYKGHTFSATEFSQAIGLRGFPTTLFLEKDGDLIANVPGYIKKDSMLEMLKLVKEKKYLKK